MSCYGRRKARSSFLRETTVLQKPERWLRDILLPPVVHFWLQQASVIKMLKKNPNGWAGKAGESRGRGSTISRGPDAGRSAAVTTVAQQRLQLYVQLRQRGNAMHWAYFQSSLNNENLPPVEAQDSGDT